MFTVLIVRLQALWQRYCLSHLALSPQCLAWAFYLTSFCWVDKIEWSRQVLNLGALLEPRRRKDTSRSDLPAVTCRAREEYVTQADSWVGLNCNQIHPLHDEEWWKSLWLCKSICSSSLIHCDSSKNILMSALFVEGVRMSQLYCPCPPNVYE